ncbi:putative NBD/HSP70 family sugar kinase [Microbacterium sp. AK009]|uniref:ROK family transcriptional regulator n=1 Tax=Microbacterium sp. AK009 TaxID=2723068 RepID=UPI0015C96538|nr:ROK family transcriptional regulator [Microbacterium sp. AK009]NYF16020.1 putative NBD/HSP70 family sugar kinase [Microbacterium sp. AK009]
MTSIPVSSPASLAVFRRILTHGPLGRVDISRATGLSQAAVTKAVTPLLSAGFVVETDIDRAAPSIGRPVNPLAIAAHRAHIVGIKVTADRTYGVLTDLGANVLARAERANASPAVEDVVAAAVDILSSLRTSSEAAIDGVGAAVSGDVDRTRGIVRDSPLLGWRDVPLAAQLEAEMGIPVILENDVRALTVTQLFFGAGRDADSFAVVTVGTGVGCGLYLNGKVVQGSHGVAGEIGHLPLGPAHARCSCGRLGCVEAVASTAAIVNSVRKDKKDPTLEASDVFALAHAGDASAHKAFERAGGMIGLALATLVNLVGPSTVIIAGENVTEYELYEKHLRATFAEHAFGTASECEIVLRPHNFDDWARGAAACVIETIASGGSVTSPVKQHLN